MIESTEGPALEATAERFDEISITLHWLTALLIIVLFASAWSREAVDHDIRLASALMTVHRTTGVVTWIVEWVRLVWRYNFAYLPPFPESMPKLQRWIAKANEYGLMSCSWCSPSRASAMSCFTVGPSRCSSGKCRRYWHRTPASAPCSRRLMSLAPKPSSPSLVCMPAPRLCTATDVTGDFDERTSRAHNLELVEQDVKNKSLLSRIAHFKVRPPYPAMPMP